MFTKPAGSKPADSQPYHTLVQPTNLQSHPTVKILDQQQDRACIVDFFIKTLNGSIDQDRSLLGERVIQMLSNNDPFALLLDTIKIGQELSKEKLQELIDNIVEASRRGESVNTRLLPCVLIRALKHPSIQSNSLEELLSWAVLLSQKPDLDDDLKQKCISSFWEHPSIQTASRERLIQYLDQIPDMYKIPFLTRMLTHPRYQPTTLAEIGEFSDLFNRLSNSSTCPELLAREFYAALFKNPVILAAKQRDLVIFEAAPEAYQTAVLAQIVGHLSFASAGPRLIMDIMDTFASYHEKIPASKEAASMFYSAFFKHPNIHLLTAADFTWLRRTTPEPLQPFLVPLVLKYHPEILSKEALFSFMRSPENAPKEEVKNLLRDALFHSALTNLPREELFREVIEPAKGQTRTSRILLLLSVLSPYSFTAQEFEKLRVWFVEEQGPSDIYLKKAWTRHAADCRAAGKIQELKKPNEAGANEIVQGTVQQFNSSRQALKNTHNTNKKPR